MEIALYKPEIPPNTGNIGRLCWCTGSRLHIVDRPAFSLNEAAVRRAGLDYWEKLDLSLHASWEAFRDATLARRDGENGAAPRVFFFTRFATKLYCDVEYRPSDIFLFGSESKGLPDAVKAEARERWPERLLRIPVSDRCRSLNLGNTATLILYEALRQQGFPGLTTEYSPDADPEITGRY